MVQQPHTHAGYMQYALSHPLPLNSKYEYRIIYHIGYTGMSYILSCYLERTWYVLRLYFFLNTRFSARVLDPLLPRPHTSEPSKQRVNIANSPRSDTAATSCCCCLLLTCAVCCCLLLSAAAVCCCLLLVRVAQSLHLST